MTKTQRFGNLAVVSFGLVFFLMSCVSTHAEDARQRRNNLVQTSRDIINDSEAAERLEISIPYQPRFEVSGFNDPGLSAASERKVCGSQSEC